MFKEGRPSKNSWICCGDRISALMWSHRPQSPYKLVMRLSCCRLELGHSVTEVNLPRWQVECRGQTRERSCLRIISMANSMALTRQINTNKMCVCNIDSWPELKMWSWWSLVVFKNMLVNSHLVYTLSIFSNMKALNRHCESKEITIDQLMDVPMNYTWAN